MVGSKEAASDTILDFRHRVIIAQIDSNLII